jgi:hypothetical protein
MASPDVSKAVPKDQLILSIEKVVCVTPFNFSRELNIVGDLFLTNNSIFFIGYAPIKTYTEWLWAGGLLGAAMELQNERRAKKTILENVDKWRDEDYGLTLAERKKRRWDRSIEYSRKALHSVDLRADLTIITLGAETFHAAKMSEKDKTMLRDYQSGPTQFEAEASAAKLGLDITRPSPISLLDSFTENQSYAQGLLPMMLGDAKYMNVFCQELVRRIARENTDEQSKAIHICKAMANLPCETSGVVKDGLEFSMFKKYWGVACIIAALLAVVIAFCIWPSEIIKEIGSVSSALGFSVLLFFSCAFAYFWAREARKIKACLLVFNSGDPANIVKGMSRCAWASLKKTMSEVK